MAGMPRSAKHCDASSKITRSNSFSRGNSADTDSGEAIQQGTSWKISPANCVSSLRTGHTLRFLVTWCSRSR
jgi:hypothetical protein